MKKLFVSAAIHRVKRDQYWSSGGPQNGWQIEIVTVDERQGSDGSYFHSDETSTVWWPDYPKVLAYLEEVIKTCDKE